MSIEGNVLANAFANAATDKAYRDSVTDTVQTAASISDENQFLALSNPAITPSIAKTSELNMSKVASTSPGDEVLKTIQNISDFQNDSVKNLTKTVQDISKSEEITMTGLVEMQGKMMEFQLKHEVLSKSASSINQGIQTLFKNQ